MTKNKSVIVPLNITLYKIKKRAKRALEIIYPRACPVCDELIGDKKARIHKKCQEKLPLIVGDVCKKCGALLKEEGDEYCYDCLMREHIFNQGRVLYIRNDITRNMIYRFKYEGHRYIGEFLGEQLGKYFYEQLKAWKIDAIVPVPIHKSRLRTRGFNQSLDIAKALQEYLYRRRVFIPIYKNLVLRNKKTKRQKDLSTKERKNNIFNAFTIGKAIRIPRRVLVVDDIYTTGNTLDEVSKCLKDNGVEEVYFLAITTSTML